MRDHAGDLQHVDGFSSGNSVSLPDSATGYFPRFDIPGCHFDHQRRTGLADVFVGRGVRFSSAIGLHGCGLVSACRDIGLCRRPIAGTWEPKASLSRLPQGPAASLKPGVRTPEAAPSFVPFRQAKVSRDCATRAGNRKWPSSVGAGDSAIDGGVYESGNSLKSLQQNSPRTRPLCSLEKYIQANSCS